MKNTKEQKGITLIALIITIIVMLILVAVTVSVALDGGLFGKASNASNDTKEAVIREQLQDFILGKLDVVNRTLEVDDDDKVGEITIDGITYEVTAISEDDDITITLTNDDDETITKTLKGDLKISEVTLAGGEESSSIRKFYSVDGQGFYLLSLNQTDYSFTLSMNDQTMMTGSFEWDNSKLVLDSGGSVMEFVCTEIEDTYNDVFYKVLSFESLQFIEFSTSVPSSLEGNYAWELYPDATLIVSNVEFDGFGCVRAFLDLPEPDDDKERFCYYLNETLYVFAGTTRWFKLNGSDKTFEMD